MILKPAGEQTKLNKETLHLSTLRDVLTVRRWSAETVAEPTGSSACERVKKWIFSRDWSSSFPTGQGNVYKENHTHTHAQIHTITHEKCKWCICNCVTSERRTEKCENVTVKVTIPLKLSLLCVSIYAVKAERKNTSGCCIWGRETFWVHSAW